MIKVINSFLEWLPQRECNKCVLIMSRRWIEHNFDKLPIKLIDIFYGKTWSLEFLERTLLPEQTDMWDHISTWYTLSDAFCDRNIEWLNFHELVYSQVLSKSFYIRHLDRIDWIPSKIDLKNLYTELYSR